MKKKICFSASSGGHLSEILQLIELGDSYRIILLTEKTNHTLKLDVERVITVPQVNRRELFAWLKLVRNYFISLRLICEEHPDVVVSTGALSTVPICLIAHRKHIRLIYIESFARVYSASMTGKLLYHLADVTVVQWKELLNIYPEAIYGGGIF